ncbi:hypothetical protein PMKS-000233 [Pichia membranifaciens]|uniref:AP-3 complex subunit delta n=1 Tax=Pichia membranifaciens TaxID=4926 RepID=A0A1Q2YB56_9ASCO|nr:hypothetical protein PMKS-000233 [Pichia membranifaciens]
MDMRERLRPFGISFEKSLEDLIRGIRSTSSDPEKAAIFLDKAIQECKAELKTSDLELKSTAILKLAYLEMYGFDMSWCSFNILEVMASPKFQHKRIGYLAAIQILQRQNNDDALMLMTNLLKKDLNSVHYIETSLAISGIAAVVSKDLALDIVDDMAKMLSHSKPLIRKKAVLAMFKIFLKNPEALRAYYDRIVEKLEDPDGAVVSATVNVICELAHMNPSNYIDLAPRLYAMLKESNNNWMVIRLLKLFSSLSLTEPRLKYKLLPEIKSLMLSTKALSLTYECINAILNGNMLSSDDIETAHLIVEKLLIFFESNDQNLRYVGLLAFIKTCKIHQKLIKKHDKIILTSIYDNDLTIRETSLDIVNSLVSEQNIVAIVTRLTVQLLPYKEQQEHLDEINRKLLSMENEREGELEEDGEDEDYEKNSYNLIGSSQQPIVVSDKYKFLLINKIIEICSMNNYENIPNFKWYLGVLHDILKLNVDNKVSNVDSIISQQLVDIGVRVPSVRPKLVDMCLELCHIPGSSDEKVLMFKNGLSNCIWIVGEYYDEYIQDADVDSDADSRASNSDIGEDTKYSAIQIVDSISKQRSLERLGHINFDGTVSIYIQAIAKIFSKFCSIFGENKWSRSQFESVNSLSKKIITWFNKFQNSPNFEVQERALSFIEVLKLVEESIQSELETLESSGDDTAYPSNFLIKGFVPLFTATTIKPVGLKTQSKIQPPVDLDLGDAFDDQSVVDLQHIYNRLKMEDLDINFSDDEVDDDKSEREDIYDEGTETDTENNSAFDDSGSERKQKKMPKNDHEDDPYYISFDDSHDSNKKENNTGKNEMSAEDAKKKHKKSLKPKKYKKEKVLRIEDDDDVDNAIKHTAKHSTEKDNETPKHSAFLFDSSRLAGVDLKHSESTEEAFTNEYKEEVEKETDIPHEIKIETPSVQPVKRKPKKKVKKKVAVIE